MCGGRLVLSPCSHVGHIFRDKQPYSFPGGDNVGTFLKNSQRIAEVHFYCRTLRVNRTQKLACRSSCVVAMLSACIV